MLERLRTLGYTGRVSILKDFVHPLRPPKVVGNLCAAMKPTLAQQLQFDWGEFQYEQDGVRRKLYGFTAILSYSRMRFVVFTKRCDAATMIRCLMEACEYFGGVPRTMLTDRMKSVLLQVEDGVLQWHPLFADFMVAIGVAPRVCKPYTPQTKGKVERSVGILKQDFWPGMSFTTSTTSIGKLAHGVNGATTASIAPLVNVPRPAGARKAYNRCRVIGPGNAGRPRSVKSVGMGFSVTMVCFTVCLPVQASSAEWCRCATGRVW